MDEPAPDGTPPRPRRLALEELFQHARDAIGFDDAEGNVVYANRAFRRLFRIPDDAEDLGRLSDYVPAGSGSRLTKVHESRMRDGRAPDRYVFEATRRDGSLVWVEASVVPVVQDGEPLGTHCVIRDISAQKAREAALRAENESVLELLESMPLAVHALDREGNVVAWNPASEGMFGWSRKEVLGRPYPLVPEDKRVEFGEVLRDSFELRRPVRGRETQRLRRDGSKLEVAIWSTPLAGVVEEMHMSLAVLVDISKQRRAQQSSRSLFEGALDALIIFEPDSEIVLDVNPKASEMYGFPKEEFIGMSLREISDDVPRGRRAIERVLDERGVKNFETVHHRADGSALFVESSASLVEYEGQIAILTINRDVTKRRQLHEQLVQAQRREAVGQLAAGVAHEFNNVLAAVIATAESSLDTVDDERARERLHAMIHRAEHGAQLTRRMLSFSRGGRVSREAIALDDYIEGLLPLLRRLVGDGVSVGFEPSAAGWSAHANPGEVEQILVNLVSNARDAIRGRGRVVMATRAVSFDAPRPTVTGQLDPGSYIELEVRDSGSGMSPEVMGRICDPFFTTKPHGKGTGLGLPMVLGLMREDGGGLDISSTPGSGSAFTLAFPAHQGEASSPMRGRETSALGTETILVVDDEPLLRSSISDSLTAIGYRVLQAADAEEARRLFDSAPDGVDVVITDMSMPGESGQELATDLVARDEALRVLLVSGYVDDGSMTRLPRTSFLEKPFTRAQLTRAIRVLLEE